jgi:hypothetical protein
MSSPYPRLDSAAICRNPFCKRVPAPPRTFYLQGLTAETLLQKGFWLSKTLCGGGFGLLGIHYSPNKNIFFASQTCFFCYNVVLNR